MALGKCLLLKHGALNCRLLNPHKSWMWWSLTLELGVRVRRGRDVETGVLLELSGQPVWHSDLVETLSQDIGWRGSEEEIRY